MGEWERARCQSDSFPCLTEDRLTLDKGWGNQARIYLSSLCFSLVFLVSFFINSLQTASRKTYWKLWSMMHIVVSCVQSAVRWIRDKENTWPHKIDRPLYYLLTWACKYQDNLTCMSIYLIKSFTEHTWYPAVLHLWAFTFAREIRENNEWM